LALDVLTNMLFKRRIIHPRVRLMFEQIRLVQIKTIIAIDIAFCAGGFVHRMKAIVPPGGKRRELKFWLLHSVFYLLILVILLP